MARVTASPLGRIVIAQFVVTVLSSTTLLVFDWVAAYSALLGGVACGLPGLYALVMSLGPHRVTGSGLGRALKGESGRIAITIAILLGVFMLVKPLNAWAFFGLFAGLQLVYGIVPFLDARRLRRPPE